MNSSTNSTEYPIPEGEVLVSKTDLNGFITYCNSTFIEASGYSKEELIGSPHNLLRHPDMPEQAFSDLWKTVRANKPWRGLIKNQRRDGRYYWAESDITPYIENGITTGYVAFRYKATPEQIAQADAAYRAINSGASNLYIYEGKIVALQNRLMRWLNARSIKFRIAAFMSALFGILAVLGIFNLHEASNAYRVSVDSLESTRMESYALDNARMAEVELQTQMQTWKAMLFTDRNQVRLERHLELFDKQGTALDSRLGLLKTALPRIGLPTDAVDAALEAHKRLNGQYHSALKSFDINRPESVLTVDDRLKGPESAMQTSLDQIVSDIQGARQSHLKNIDYALQQAHQSEYTRAIVMLVIAALVGLFLSMRFVVSLTQPMRSTSKSLKKVVKLQQHFLNNILRLEIYRDRIDEQQRVGNFIMSRMTAMPEQLDSSVRRYTRPAEHLSGDILIASVTPGNAIHILLADAVGHGLTAAINVLPLCQTFYELTHRGFRIDRIAAVLNDMIHQFMPVDRFVSAALISIDRNKRVIEVWNGGIPAPQLFDIDGKLIHSWESQHLPLGIVPSEEFSAPPEVFRYLEYCQLCLYSDGLMESKSPYGEIFGNQRIVELFGRTPPSARYDALIAAFDRHLDGRPAHDDISLAVVEIPAGISPSATLACKNEHSRIAAGGADDWCIAISLSADELKHLDIVPLVTRITRRIRLTRKDNAALFQILSELFNTALDQGILHLEPHHALNSSEYQQYLELRDERLQRLDSGKIDLQIERVLIDDQHAIRIRVAHRDGSFSGDTPINAPTAEREIGLTRSLAYKLECTANEISACYLCEVD